MTDESITLTDAQLGALAARVAAWATELSDGERRIVGALLARAALPRDDAEGFAAGSPFLGMMKGLEAQDRMGNFEIQRLMSAYNQAETLASSVEKKLDDTTNATIGKI